MRGGATVVFLKECRENLRDRRSVINALGWGPMLMPILFLGQMVFLAKQQQEIWEKPPTLAIAGADYAPGLMQFLRRQGAEVRPVSGDPAQVVREQLEDVVISVAPEFPESWRKGEPAGIEVFYDLSRRRSDSKARRARSLIDQYSATIGSLRLMVRGIDPRVGRPIVTVERDVSEGGASGAVIASFLPFVLMFSAFLGGFYLAVDTTAGERERQSLEPLLTNPVSRVDIVLGKLLATVVFSLAATVIGIVAFAVCLVLTVKFAPVETLGLEFSVSPYRWVALTSLLLPVVLLASALQTLVATFSRTFREAQTYVQLLMFVPMVPCFVVLFNPVKPTMADMALPFWSQTVMIDRILRGESVDPLFALAAGGATTAAALVVALVIVQLYRGERLLFTSP